MKMKIKCLRAFFSHNKTMYKNLSQVSKIYLYLRDIGLSLSPNLDLNFMVLQATEINIFTMKGHHFQMMILSAWRILLQNGKKFCS